MNKNGVIAVVIVIGAVVLIGLWVMRSGQNRQAARQFDCVEAPSAPGDLQSAVEGGVVHLSWTAPSGETPTSYVIEAGSAPGEANQGTFVTAGTSTSFEREAPAGTYYVRVFARNACGTSPSGGDVTVTVP
ncbi:MAG: fibronectin type III domain-containing protein [Vicinamibacterales bacterium]